MRQISATGQVQQQAGRFSLSKMKRRLSIERNLGKRRTINKTKKSNEDGIMSILHVPTYEHGTAVIVALSLMEIEF